MSESSCTEIREILSAGGASPPEPPRAVAEHLRACASCRSEAALVGALRGSTPLPPLGLAARILTAVEEDRLTAAGTRRSRSLPPWAFATAATAVLALGTSLLWPFGPDERDGALARVALDPVPEGWIDEGWIDEDALVAGAPVFDALTVDALALLLEEME